MEIKKIKIGNIETENNVFLAPLAGYSDSAMRVICESLGAGLTFTEMVSAKGLKYSSENTENLLFSYPEQKIKAVQIFGSDSEIMGEIACSEYLKDFQIIDINMGCPVRKIYSNGEGSALLNNLPLASKIISSVAKSGKPVTVKFRIGINDSKYVTEDFAKMCEDSGASLITVHGRTREQIYSGEVHFEEIYKAKRAVKIPVIANGGVFTKEDANELMEKTGADGIMIARGAMNNPLIFSEILGSSEKIDFKSVMLKHLSLLEERYGVERTAVIFRKQMSCYLKGVKGAKRFREQVFSATNSKDIKKVIQSLNL